MNNPIKEFNSLTNNVNELIKYYANHNNDLYIVAIQKFWGNVESIMTLPIRDMISLFFADKINELINKTQDFTQYKNNHMPISIKFALINIKETVKSLGIEDIIPIKHIVIYAKKQNI